MRLRLVSLVLALVVLSCAPPELGPGAGDAVAGAGGGDALAGAVALYDPNAAFNGYTLDFYRRRHPMLIDMRGNVVREWPQVRMASRVRLTRECTLLGLSTGRAVVEHDWDGRKIWSVQLEERFQHHDAIRLANGNTMFISRASDSVGDDVLEVDPEGNVVWEWLSLEPLDPYIEAMGRRTPGDPVHMNSVQELPDNPWFRAGDDRFRPGNVLLSARNINLVFIVDKATREIVWTYRGDLSLQHEAIMAGPESAHAGHILILDNRFKSFWIDRRSVVLEIDPRDGSIVWSYTAPGFHSSTGGSQQLLPNGNVLISSSNNARVFEVDRSGRTVWEWTPRFKLYRPSRYGRDHCARLAELPRPDGPPIRPPKDYRYTDRDSYLFARPDLQRNVDIDGAKRFVLKPSYRCGRVLIPDDASVGLRYGVDRSRLERLGLEAYRATFSLTLRNPESDQSAVVFEDTVGPDGEGWRERTLGLGALARELVEMCVEVTEEGLEEAKPGTLAFWAAPAIRAGRDDAKSEDDEVRTDLTAEELEVRMEHLRAMGYVN